MNGAAASGIDPELVYEDANRTAEKGAHQRSRSCRLFLYEPIFFSFFGSQFFFHLLLDGFSPLLCSNVRSPAIQPHVIHVH